VDLNTVLQESLVSLRGRLGTTKVDVVERLAAALPVIIADAVLLEQAFGGILENALDAMTDGPGILTIVTGVEGARPEGVRVFAEVHDTGGGIRPDDLGKVFELFFTTKSTGTGLGLALARKFVEAYGGTLTVTSDPGHGAVFRAVFPAAGGA
jgi:signal transduction histidine kinase